MLAGAVAGNDVAGMFDEFRTKFNRKYASPQEELQRMKIFIKNVEAAEKMGSLDLGATYGHLSPMADLDEVEYASYNTLKVTKDLLREHAAAARKIKSDMAVPTNFDWREKGAVGKVKNQQQCGSCWSFATIANIEGANQITNGELLSLSEQELVDCDHRDNGCGGGLPSNAYKDLISTSTGLELESAYPYVASDGSCKADKSLMKVFLSSWVPVSTDEGDMALALMKYGPLAIGINAGPMQMYMGGIADPFFCSPAGLDHGVALVAFGEEGSKKYWVIKNSWGPEWGEDGYYRIVRGKGKCGMNRMVTSAIVKSNKDDVYV